MGDQPRLSTYEIIQSLRDSQRKIARAHSEIDAVIARSREALARSTELLAKADHVLRSVF